MRGSMHCRLEVPVQVRFPTLRQVMTPAPLPVGPF